MFLKFTGPASLLGFVGSSCGILTIPKPVTLTILYQSFGFHSVFDELAGWQHVWLCGSNRARRSGSIRQQPFFSMETLTEKIARLKQQKACLTLARREAQKMLKKENRRLARLRSVLNKMSEEDLNQCLHIARAKPKARPKAKSAARDVPAMPAPGGNSE